MHSEFDCNRKVPMRERKRETWRAGDRGRIKVLVHRRLKDWHLSFPVVVVVAKCQLHNEQKKSKRSNRLLKYFQAPKLIQFPPHNLLASVQKLT